MWVIFNKIGFAICHQIPERSFWVDGNQLPLCSRCSGIYLGFFITLALYFVTRFMRHKKPSMPPNLTIGFISIFFILAMVFNAISPLIGIPTSNLLRFVTGILFGLSLPLFLLPAINYSPKSNHDKERVINNKEYLFLILFALIFVVLVYLKINFAFYIIAYLSIIGLLLFIMLVNTALVALILENLKFTKVTPYYYSMLLGSILAGMELFIFSQLHNSVINFM